MIPEILIALQVKEIILSHHHDPIPKERSADVPRNDHNHEEPTEPSPLNVLWGRGPTGATGPTGPMAQK